MVNGVLGNAHLLIANFPQIYVLHPWLDRYALNMLVLSIM